MPSDLALPRAALSAAARALIAAPKRGAEDLKRRIRRLGLRYGLPGARIVYDPRYLLPESRLVDGQRALRILEHLDGEHLFTATQITRPHALRMRDVMRVHGADYLASLDDPRELDRVFAARALAGVEPTAVLEAHRWATAGTVCAAITALRYPWLKSPVVNLGGGFHHARRDKGSGFCALNDVAIAIDRLRAGGMRGNILVVDLDYHHGDGTRSIFADDPTVYTYSIHAQSWDDTNAVASLDVELGPAVGDETFLSALDATLPEAFERAAPKFVFYVAGSDVAGTDALGNWRLGADTVAARDRRVLDRAQGIPTVMVLAGGYGKEAWRYPARAVTWLLTKEDTPIPTAEERALAGFRAIRRSISDGSLRVDPKESDDGFGITEADIYGDLFDKAPDRRLLGFYSTFGLEVAFERYGLADHLRSRGYEHFFVDTDPKVGTVGEGVRVWSDPNKEAVLIELVLSDLHLEVGPSEPGGRLLSIEWLLLQDPNARPRGGQLLVGQRHAGLGCLKIVVGMLVMACERLGYDGLCLVPAHYHVAAVARGLLSFLDPSHEAAFVALAAATHHLALGDASRLIENHGVVHRATGAPVAYEPARMVLAVSDAMKARLSGPSYAREVEALARDLDLVTTEIRTAG